MVTSDAVGLPLPPKGKKLFEHVVFHADKSLLHGLDWDRFYRIVRDNRMKVQLSDPAMKRLLLDNGFPERNAAMICEVYWHLECI